MSKLHKSPLFRSKIPIRKIGCKQLSYNANEYSDIKINLKSNRSVLFDQISNSEQSEDFERNCNRFISKDCYYSTYSSNDESDDSVAAHKKISEQYANVSVDDFMCLSTDAISLDGLLDTISCGSNFSSPPSPSFQNTQNNQLNFNINSQIQSEMYQTTENDDKSFRKTLESHNVTESLHRMPKHSLSLPRKSISNSMIYRKENVSTETQCEPKSSVSTKVDNINFPCLPPYYCQPSYKSSMKNSTVQRDTHKAYSTNHKLNGNDLKDHLKDDYSLEASNRQLQLVKGHSHSILRDGRSNKSSTNTENKFVLPLQKEGVLKKSQSTIFKSITSSDTELCNQNETTSTIKYDSTLTGRNLIQPSFNQKQIQLQLQQHPQTRQLFAVIQEEVFQPKPKSIYNGNVDFSDSYVSLECPSPPEPPSATSEVQKYPEIRLSNYFRKIYQEIVFKEQIGPRWTLQTTNDVLCPSRFEPELRLNLLSHGISDHLTVDQLLISIETKDGNFLEAPRRCVVECPSWASRKNISLRILHAWAKGPLWPTKGIPVELTLFIPLLELRKSLAHFLEKEILPKGTLNPLHNCPGGFYAAWSALEALGSKLLIILDGYTGQTYTNSTRNYSTSPRKTKIASPGNGIGLNPSSLKSQYPSDVYDLLDGKLFPEARIIILTNCSNCLELMPIVQRHVMYEGLTWGKSASILEGGHWGGPSHLINLVHENINLRQAIKTPLGCLAIATIYANSNGHLPTEELDVVEAIFNCVAPQVLTYNVSELGRLALFCLKTKRPYFTLSEIKMYCSAVDVISGCLEKDILFGKTANKKGDNVFHPICEGMLEYLSANYIASLVNRPGLLSAEITGLAISDELDIDLLKVLKYSMSLLGSQAHVLLSKLTPLWLPPQTVFTLALAGTHSEENMAALCEILGISKQPPISPLETKPLWVQVRSATTDLMGWGMALKSSTCTLKNLELIYQLEKSNSVECRKAVDIFIESITENESVTTLRISSLIEMDVKDSEINYLANCVSKLLLKPRLENFELVLTLIEEDPPLLKLQSVVISLCRSLPRQTKLTSLLLDLGLCTSQLVQICAALDNCPNLSRLSLPHLRCDRGAVSTVASLVNSRKISFLSLPSCWAARDDPPSSSGISMGSGSGSSTGTSCLIKQGSLPGVPSPKAYAPGIFSSLPRGMFVPQTLLGRSATLPRQPLDQTIEKRSSESIVSKNWYPTPTCDGVSHNSGTLHDLFVVIRNSYSKLHGLELSKAQLSLEDSMCLGETVRVSNTLHTLKLEGLSRISDILPSILGASESPCLQMLSIGSQRLNLDDSVIVMCARALTSCPTLRLLSIDGWSIRVEHIQTLSILRAFLSLTSIREFSMANCRFHTSLIKPDSKVVQLFECRSIVVLKLPGAQILLPDMSILRGPQLLQFISGFPYLRELDLSSPVRSGIENNASAHILDDKTVINFFQNLHTYFGLLNTLKMCNWVIHLDEMSKTIKAIGKALRNSPISHLKIDGISVFDRAKKKRCEPNFIQCFISSLPHLRWMSISLSGKKDDQITEIGSAVADLKGSEIEIKLSESTIDQAKLMAQVISLDGKFDIKVLTFGTSSGILIHAQKCGIKSLNRKHRNKEHT